MPKPAGVSALHENLHQFGLTAAWSILFNISVICILMKQYKYAYYTHSICGFLMLIMTYGCILQILVPFGFNINVQENGVLLETHAIVGLLMLAFVLAQVIIGLMAKTTQESRTSKSTSVLFIIRIHRAIGYSMALIYKIDILIAWVETKIIVFYILLGWEVIFLCILIYFKIYYPHLEEKIIDQQVSLDESSIQKVSSNQQIQQLTGHLPYIIFNSYIYCALPLKRLHPGGYQIIKIIENREVDRFLYGMYAPEMLPQTLLHSHRYDCLKILGKPIGKYHVPLTYAGFQGKQFVDVNIDFIQKISERSMIYLLGLMLKKGTMQQNQFEFKGYTDIRQLGQYYSLTMNNQTTRLYSAVNFTNEHNLKLMSLIFKKNFFKKEYISIGKKGEMVNPIQQDFISERDSRITDKRQSKILFNQRKTEFKKKRESEFQKKRQSEMTHMKESFHLQANYQQPYENHYKGSEHTAYLPIMIKIYKNGKFTSKLYHEIFRNQNLKLSLPKGKGLQLFETKPGTIVILAGGTGQFPFLDLIDLLFKTYLIEQKHEETQNILITNPLLKSKPFQHFKFVFLIAINQPEDLHEIIVRQLRVLSNWQEKIKIIIRVKKNSKQILRENSKIILTKEYFGEMAIKECMVKDFSKLWVCGPPKMNTSAARAMLGHGYLKEDFILI